MAREPALLSIAAPMHDEEGIAAQFHARVVAAAGDVPFELVIVDDGSRDDTPQILAEIAAGDERVKVVTLSRNFGHQAALTAGLEHVRGDAVVMLDADLQDPPEVIPELVERWRGGADVVYAVRQSREGETRMKLATAHVFYRLMARLAQIGLPADPAASRWMARRRLEALLPIPEACAFLRGRTFWTVSPKTPAPYSARRA